MKNSELFEDIFIPQVQGVSWLNTEYEEEKSADANLLKELVDFEGEGGDFYLYPYKEDTGSKKKVWSCIIYRNSSRIYNLLLLIL